MLIVSLFRALNIDSCHKILPLQSTFVQKRSKQLNKTFIRPEAHKEYVLIHGTWIQFKYNIFFILVQNILQLRGSFTNDFQENEGWGLSCLGAPDLINAIASGI